MKQAGNIVRPVCLIGNKMMMRRVHGFDVGLMHALEVEKMTMTVRDFDVQSMYLLRNGKMHGY